MLILKIWL